MSKMNIEQLKSYDVGVSVVSGDLFSATNQAMAPLFADYDREAGKSKTSSQRGDWMSINANDKLVYHSGENWSADLKATFACAWNEKGFAITVKVADDEYLPPNEQEYQMFKFDSIQLYFDQLDNARPNSPHYDNDDVVYQIGCLNGVPTAYLEHGQEGRYLGAENKLCGIDRDVKVKVEHANGEISYDIFFPWKTLPRVNPAAGGVFGFSLLVHDRDGNGVCGISLDTTTPFKHPFVWKPLLLRKQRINQ
jgi:hypothetical protein